MHGRFWLLASLGILVPAAPHAEIKCAVRPDGQFVHNPDQREIDGHKLLVRHREGGLSRAHHHAQIADTSIHRVGRHLQMADRLHLFVQRLDYQQLQPFGAAVLDGAYRCATDSAEQHTGSFTPVLFNTRLMITSNKLAST